MKNILRSLLIIGAVAAAVIGGTVAYFSDEEVFTNNSITAGTIDIAVENENPWTSDEEFKLENMMPGAHEEEIDFTIENVGNNPLVVWKKISIISRSTGTQSEPECEAEGGTWDGGVDTCNSPTNENNMIDKKIHYSMDVENKTLIDEDWDVMMYDIRNLWIPLGKIAVGDSIGVEQTYLLDEDAGNKLQGDEVVFNIELYAEQLMGPGPSSTSRGVVLENKDASDHWVPIIDGTWGFITWNGSGDYTTKAWGLDDGLDYRTAYYDGATETGIDSSYTSPSSGAVEISGNYTGFNSNPDAKYWLRPDSGSNGNTLWEANLVN